MKQEIRFRGLTLNRDERAVDNGELALCGGAELHDGSLRPSVLAGTTLADGAALTGTLLYVHRTASYTHYITRTNEALYFAYVNSSGQLVTKTIVDDDAFSVDTITSVESVGNTLICMTDIGLRYFLYKSTSGNYKHLGSRIPFVRLQFRPSHNYKGTYDRSTVENTDTDPTVQNAWRAMTFKASDACSASDSARQVSIKADKQADVTDAVWALINQTNDTIAKDGHFYAPFFIRYCYRLYDGSMVMHSAPVFMQVSLPLAYKVYSPNVHSHTGATSGIFDITNEINIRVEDGTSKDFKVTRFTARYTPNNVSICWRLASTTELTNLQNNWADIVKSIDIFVSPMIAREDSSQKIQRMIIEDNQYGVRSVGSLSTAYYTSWVSYWIKNNDATVRSNVIFDIPMLSDDAYIQKIRDTSTFFKIKSFKVDDTFPTAWSEMDYDKSIVPYITTQEQMTDDYKTHNTLRPVEDGGMYTYNHRLNVFGCKEQLFDGFLLGDMVNLCTDIVDYSPVTVTKIMVEIDTEDGKKYVETTQSVSVPQFIICNSPLFYPDARASRMVIYYTNSYGSQLAVSYRMEPCAMLNGAMAVTPLLDRLISGAVYAGNITYTVDRYAPLLNKIYTSEVNNPYYFPLEGINTVGVGTIRGLAATTRALSQGQFGQYPLMAFCTDGIWALNVSSTGTYSSIHPISREVCVNAKSICQLDQSVMFATGRALSRVVESAVASCSDMLDGPIVLCGTLLPHLRKYFEPVTDEETGQTSGGNAAILALMDFNTPPIDYFKSGTLLYDFANSRVIVLPASPSTTAAFPVYVFSIRDQSWSTMLMPALKTAVNSYPYPYIQKADGSLLTLDKPYDYASNAVSPAIVITRTLTFAVAMGVIQALEQHHDCATAPVLFLFGSNNGRAWQYIGRTARLHAPYLPTHPFRFFRIALYLQMQTSEHYQSTILDIIEKYRKL